MIDTFLEIIAPHLCCECQKIGKIMCNGCIEYIISSSQNSCIQCEKLAKDGICKVCKSTAIFQKSWLVTTRTGSIKALLDRYKFERTRSAYRPLAQLLDGIIPDVPASTQVIPIPTIPGHIRERGYDHAAIMARAFARRRGLAYSPLLRRQGFTQQRGATRIVRQQQAAAAFQVAKRLEDVPYLLIDDITTTGATLEAAARTLRAAGARTIWVAAIAKQPLDDTASL